MQSVQTSLWTTENPFIPRTEPNPSIHRASGWETNRPSDNREHKETAVEGWAGDWQEEVGDEEECGGADEGYFV